MSSVNKFIAVALLFTAMSLFSQVYSCRYRLRRRSTRHNTVFQPPVNSSYDFGL